MKDSKRSRVIQSFISIGLIFTFLGGFFMYPSEAQKIIIYTLYAGFGLAGIAFVLIFISLVWRRFFPKSFAKSGIELHDRPSLGLVGSEGKGSALQIMETAEGTVVAWSSLDYAFILIGTFLFGPLLISYVFTHYGKTAAGMPAIFFIIMIAVCGSATYAFFSTLWTLLKHRPTLLIKSNAIEFRRGHQPAETFWSHRIEQVFIEDHTYVYQGDSGTSHCWPNYILTIRMEGGATKRLCISDKKEQIESLKSAIEKKFQLNV